MRILLIEDTDQYFEEFSDLLKRSKISCRALDRARDAMEGARMMACDAHDIYFVDYRLPGDDGLALIEQARDAGLTKPVIMLTAYDHPNIDAAAERSGATDYLPKGQFSPEMLGRAIRYALRNAEALAAAQQAANRLRIAQEAAQIGNWEWDLLTDQYIWSARMYDLFGLDPANATPIRQQDWWDLVHDGDRETLTAALAASISGAKPFEATFRINRPDATRPGAPSTVRWLIGRGEVVRGATGAPLRLVGVNVDVTDQQNALAEVRAGRQDAEAGLQRAEYRFRTYFDSAAECLFHVQVMPDGRFLYEAMNPAGLSVAGLPIGQVLGRTPAQVLGLEAGGIVTKGLRRARDTGRPFFHEQSFEAPGRIGAGKLTFDAAYMPLRDEAGRITGILGSERDVTERRRLEASLRQAQKMESLGHLAGGVAHDFNNLLTGMIGCFELLHKYVTAEKGLRLLSEGTQAVRRGTALTARLLAFSRQQPLAAETVDVNLSIEEMADMLDRTLGGGVHIDRRLDPLLWRAFADRNQIELAILNLAINARDAMPLGGSLTIETSNLVVGDAQDDVLAPGDYVALALSDTGTGMSPEVLARAIEPFYTTKESGKGTGLGLSMVYGVVRQLGGEVRMSSEPGRGTCVTLFLRRAVDDPASDGVIDPATVSASEAALVPLRTGTLQATSL